MIILLVVCIILKFITELLTLHDSRDTKIGGSFNGRTPDSDSANRGSTPRPPAIE